jgi:DNA-binding LacI/PurR family transcriptional regulator
MTDSLEDPGLAAGGKGTGARVSIHNVAAYAGVSIATVSKVMQGVPTVQPENVTKVQNAIEALGYRINPLGAELRRGRRNLIGLIVPTLEDKRTAELVEQLELAVERKNFVLFVASSHNSSKREADLAGRMLDWRVAGVILLGTAGSDGSAALLLDDAGMPAIVVSDREDARPNGVAFASGADFAVKVTDALLRIVQPQR